MVISNDIDGYYLFKPSQYRHISDFRLTRAISTGDVTRVNIAFEMRDSCDKTSKILKYYFDGCWDIKIGNIASLAGIFIEIEQARSQFFEHVRFKVFDMEEGVIEFFCEDFAVESI